MTPSLTPPAYVLEAAQRCDAAAPVLDGVEGIDFLGAAAAEALSKVPLLAARCRDCAYRAGTDANLHPVTSAAATECVKRSHPFFCHKARDDLGEPTHLCAGWADALVERATNLPAYVSKGRAGLSAIVGQQVEQDREVTGVQALLDADAGHKYRLAGHADRHVSGFFRAQVSERANVVAEHAGVTVRVAGAIEGGRANPILVEHDAVFLPEEGAAVERAAQGALQRLTASQRSLLIALGEADRHGLRHTRPVAREKQSGWLQSALALFRRGFVEKHREDGTHAIGDGAGRVWLTLTAAGEALRDKITKEGDQ